jgi:hypothetical protein
MTGTTSLIIMASTRTMAQSLTAVLSLPRHMHAVCASSPTLSSITRQTSTPDSVPLVLLQLPPNATTTCGVTHRTNIVESGSSSKISKPRTGHGTRRHRRIIDTGFTEEITALFLAVARYRGGECGPSQDGCLTRNSIRRLPFLTHRHRAAPVTLLTNVE